jgi:DNA-binding IclR family transcriptional regulator
VTPRAPALDELKAQLDDIVQTEWSMSFGEREEGLAAAAVPIRNHAGEVIAALSISGPTARLTADRLEAVRGGLTAAADEVSKGLGWAARPLDRMAVS